MSDSTTRRQLREKFLGVMQQNELNRLRCHQEYEGDEHLIVRLFVDSTRKRRNRTVDPKDSYDFVKLKSDLATENDVRDAFVTLVTKWRSFHKFMWTGENMVVENLVDFSRTSLPDANFRVAVASLSGDTIHMCALRPYVDPSVGVSPEYNDMGYHFKDVVRVHAAKYHLDHMIDPFVNAHFVTNPTNGANALKKFCHDRDWIQHVGTTDEQWRRGYGLYLLHQDFPKQALEVPEFDWNYYDNIAYDGSKSAGFNIQTPGSDDGFGRKTPRLSRKARAHPLSFLRLLEIKDRCKSVFREGDDTGNYNRIKDIVDELNTVWKISFKVESMKTDVVITKKTHAKEIMYHRAFLAHTKEFVRTGSREAADKAFDESLTEPLPDEYLWCKGTDVEKVRTFLNPTNTAQHMMNYVIRALMDFCRDNGGHLSGLRRFGNGTTHLYTSLGGTKPWKLPGFRDDMDDEEIYELTYKHSTRSFMDTDIKGKDSSTRARSIATAMGIVRYVYINKKDFKSMFFFAMLDKILEFSIHKICNWDTTWRIISEMVASGMIPTGFIHEVDILVNVHNYVDITARQVYKTGNFEKAVRIKASIRTGDFICRTSGDNAHLSQEDYLRPELSLEGFLAFLKKNQLAPKESETTVSGIKTLLCNPSKDCFIHSNYYITIHKYGMVVRKWKGLYYIQPIKCRTETIYKLENHSSESPPKTMTPRQAHQSVTINWLTRMVALSVDTMGGDVNYRAYLQKTIAEQLQRHPIPRSVLCYAGDNSKFVKNRAIRGGYEDESFDKIFDLAMNDEKMYDRVAGIEVTQAERASRFPNVFRSHIKGEPENYPGEDEDVDAEQR